MIYALTSSEVPGADRQVLVDAISEWNASVLEDFARRGVTRHVMDASGSEKYYCFWCAGRVKRSRSNNPGRAARPWHFDHMSNPGGECQGQNSPPNQGCYIQLGHEDESQFRRQMCKCISDNGQTYCHHAANPGAGETACTSGI